MPEEITTTVTPKLPLDALGGPEQGARVPLGLQGGEPVCPPSARGGGGWCPRRGRKGLQTNKSQIGSRNQAQPVTDKEASHLHAPLQPNSQEGGGQCASTPWTPRHGARLQGGRQQQVHRGSGRGSPAGRGGPGCRDPRRPAGRALGLQHPGRPTCPSARPGPRPPLRPSSAGPAGRRRRRGRAPGARVSRGRADRGGSGPPPPLSPSLQPRAPGAYLARASPRPAARGRRRNGGGVGDGPARGCCGARGRGGRRGASRPLPRPASCARGPSPPLFAPTPPASPQYSTLPSSPWPLNVHSALSPLSSPPPVPSLPPRFFSLPCPSCHPVSPPQSSHLLLSLPSIYPPAPLFPPPPLPPLSTLCHPFPWSNTHATHSLTPLPCSYLHLGSPLSHLFSPLCCFCFSPQTHSLFPAPPFTPHSTL